MATLFKDIFSALEELRELLFLKLRWSLIEKSMLGRYQKSAFSDGQNKAERHKRLFRALTFSSSVFSSPFEWPLLGIFPSGVAASAAPSFLAGLSDSGASCNELLNDFETKSVSR